MSALLPAVKTALQSRRDAAATEKSARAALGDAAGAAQSERVRVTAELMAEVHGDRLT